MAASISMSSVSGYPTKNAMAVKVNFTVQYPGDYYTRFDVYDYRTDELYDTYYGSTYTMPANGRKTNLKKTLSGLQSGTKYYVEVSLWNCTYSNPGNKLPGITDTVTFTTLSESKITIKYYDGGSDGSSTGTSVTIKSASRPDWTFVGWATSTGTTSVSSTYAPGETVSAGSSSSSVNLYAVYKRETTFNCYFIKGNTGKIASNSRTKIQYLVQTSKSSYSTDYYNSITLPTFDSVNSTITTTTPNRSWTAIGWHPTSFAMQPDYSPGQTVSSNSITSDLYAMYSNECSITYNSNGGSGSMTKQTGTGYYNAFGNYEGVAFSIKNCSFTPPSGKKFDSWNTAANGTGTRYLSGGTLTTSYVNQFYAIWVKARPSNWSWPSHTADKPISSGSSMNYIKSGTTVTPTPLTAAEWLAFMNRIKEFYAYDNGKTVNSTYWNNAVNGVKSGSPLTATQVNSARYLISQLPIQTTLPSAVSSGGKITAAFVNGLKNSLNSIP